MKLTKTEIRAILDEAGKSVYGIAMVSDNWKEFTKRASQALLAAKKGKK